LAHIAPKAAQVPGDTQTAAQDPKPDSMRQDGAKNGDGKAGDGAMKDIGKALQLLIKALQGAQDQQIGELGNLLPALERASESIKPEPTHAHLTQQLSTATNYLQRLRKQEKAVMEEMESIKKSLEQRQEHLGKLNERIEACEKERSSLIAKMGSSQCSGSSQDIGSQETQPGGDVDMDLLDDPIEECLTTIKTAFASGPQDSFPEAQEKYDQYCGECLQKGVQPADIATFVWRALGERMVNSVRTAKRTGAKDASQTKRHKPGTSAS